MYEGGGATVKKISAGVELNTVQSELRWRWISGAVCLLLAHSASAGSAIHLKNRTISSFAEGSGRIGNHYMLQFRSYPDGRVRAELARRRIRVLSYVPDFTLMVSSASAPDLRGLEVQSVGSLTAADKLSPRLLNAGRGAFLVMMFPDVTPETGREVIEQQGFTVIPQAGLLPGDFAVVGPAAKLPELAASDDVSYIMPAPDLYDGPRVACAGALTESGVVAQYVEEGQGWAPSSPSGQVALNYTFESLPPNLDVNAVRSEIIRALNQWASYTNLSFSEGPDPQGDRTIDIKFASGQHGDAYPFDGPGMLAHTFYPSPPNSEPVAGDIHLNLDENWQTASASGIDLFSVALHEAGHALGLGHTDNPDSVMYPYYRILAGLSEDDIAGIRALYGTNDPAPTTDQPIDPSTPVTTPTVTTTTAATAASAPAAPATPAATTTPSTAITPPFTAPATATASSPVTPAANPPASTIPPPSTAPTVTASTPLATPAPTTAPPSGDTTPPSLQIISPASTIVSTTASSLTLTGSAWDNVGVASVTWTTSTGGSGTASGANPWSVQVPLLIGDNVVIVTAYDAAGNSSWRAITVVRW